MTLFFVRILFFWCVAIVLYADAFKVASYNVENLFDEVYDGTEYPEFIPTKHGWSRQKVDKKLQHVTEVLCDLDADIVALQEIENSRIFERLRRKLERVGCGYRYGVATNRRDTPIELAFLSRFPIVKSRQLRVGYAAGVRPIFEITVKIGSHSLLLFNNHWKSKSRDGKESRRIAYAKRLKRRLDALPPQTEYIVLGDFNTALDAYLYLPKRIDDTSGRTGLYDILKTTINDRPVDEATIRGSKVHDGSLLYDLWYELSAKMRWSHAFYGKKEALDHILLPSSMFDGKGIDYRNDSFGVFKRPYLFTRKGAIKSWRQEEGYSDHLPIYAYFDTRPYRPSMMEKRVDPEYLSIDALYNKKRLQRPVILKDVVVILKRGRYAIVKQSPEGRGIFLYRCVDGLEEGGRYDLFVEAIGDYKGLKEITDAVPLRRLGNISLSPYYALFESIEKLRQNEVIRNVVGIYRNGKLFTKKGAIPLYFKNRALKPPEGSRLKLYYAHVGYYKRLQLVVYNRKDFTILE